MTNLAAWTLLTRDLPSPEIFVKWGFYSLIAAATRRQICTNSDRPLFTNLYTLFCGPAGVGKGLITDLVGDILGAVTIPAPVKVNSKALAAMNALAPKVEVKQVFAKAADSITFPKLVEEIHNNMILSDEHGLQSPIIFLLDEFTSVFKRFAEDTVTFVNTAWNGKDHSYGTRHSGSFSLKSPMLNIIAGTTPTELEKLGMLKVIGGGFFSRMILVYSHTNRARVTVLPPLDEEQKQAKAQLINYIKELSERWYKVDFTPEAEEYFYNWYQDGGKVRVNKALILDEYYSRKVTHVRKLAMVMYFSEHLEYSASSPIDVSYIIAAIQLLDETEGPMHRGLLYTGRNVLDAIGQRMTDFIQNAPVGVTHQTLLTNFHKDCTFTELNEIITNLQYMGEIVCDKATGLYKGK